MEIKYNKTLNAFISRTTLEVLGPYGMDFERIFTFSIYMQMVVIKSCFPASLQASKAIDEILAYWIGNFSNENNSEKEEEEIASDELNSLYIANEELMMGIYNDVWNNASNDSPWIEDGNLVCIKACNEDNSPSKNCIELISTLNVHLEASCNELITTLFLIKKVLQKS